MNPSPGPNRLRAHANYLRLAALCRDSHERGRALAGLTLRDVTLARLYSHAFRAHVIGAFHATRVALSTLRPTSALARVHLLRADEHLADLANRAMDRVGEDERALVATFHHYSDHVERTLDALDQAVAAASDLPELSRVRDRFVEHMEAIALSSGIHLTRDTHAPVQGSFVVPNLGITIVPLVYGDAHSWNLAWLDGARSDVPYHLHREGVEIHLGYGPMHGYTVLGEVKAELTEGYAMPIPPNTRHGYTNIGSAAHHVPFIFGSLTCGGWGVFLDVEPQPKELEALRTAPVLSPGLSGTILLEREIARAAEKHTTVRYALIPAEVTDRGGVGGLELSIARVAARPLELQLDRFCAVSVVRGSGVVAMAGEERSITSRDHFGIPAKVPATLRATGTEPLVVLDAVIKPGRASRF